MKIELLHPINHDKKEYVQGIQDLDEELVKLFLTFKCSMSGAPIARLPEEN